MFRSVITGTGSYIPATVYSSESFTHQVFYDNSGIPFPQPTADLVDKFQRITGINERRYSKPEETSSSMGALAAKSAIENSGTDPETIDYVIFAHNFGDMAGTSHQSDSVPSLAGRVKHILGIKNPSCVAYDILFGCPGWLQALIHADAFFKAGLAKKCLIIGAETLSKIMDPFDRDSMIYADGAGACLLEYRDTDENGPGVLGTCAQSHTIEELDFIFMDQSFKADTYTDRHFLKMKGRKVYEFAMKNVPMAMKKCLDDVGVPIQNLKKIFIHQANEKMDEAIVKRFFELYGFDGDVQAIMPMSIGWLGNSSVATIPTLYDLVIKGEIPNHSVEKGDILLFASVGAGMNINAVCYRY